MFTGTPLRPIFFGIFSLILDICCTKTTVRLSNIRSDFMKIANIWRMNINIKTKFVLLPFNRMDIVRPWIWYAVYSIKKSSINGYFDIIIWKMFNRLKHRNGSDSICVTMFFVGTILTERFIIVHKIRTNACSMKFEHCISVGSGSLRDWIRTIAEWFHFSCEIGMQYCLWRHNSLPRKCKFTFIRFNLRL